ncbi:MAG TPA: hypothetical protein VGL26_07500 [Jatrophihabitans sp.]|jgi:hypothetical protein
MPEPEFRIGEDVAALVEGAQRWARDFARSTFGQLGEAYPHTGSDCQWCPVCQFAALVRGERPELAEKIAVAAGAVADVLKAIVASAPYGEGAAEEPKQQDGVEHIHLAE